MPFEPIEIVRGFDSRRLPSLVGGVGAFHKLSIRLFTYRLRPVTDQQKGLVSKAFPDRDGEI
jgi:hypothetical protein